MKFLRDADASDTQSTYPLSLCEDLGGGYEAWYFSDDLELESLRNSIVLRAIRGES